LDSQYQHDRAILNGTEIKGDGLERVKKALDRIRKHSKVKNKALVISRNLLTVNREIARGKGLGTSASASAALTSALISIIYDNHPKYLKNFRLRSFFSRYLSGSGCRSSTGGISLWLSHPHIKPFNCFSFRLDNQNHKDLMNKTAILTIPIESDLKTNLAHEIAPQSLFFETWLKNRKSLVYKLYNGLKSSNLELIGQLAEYDTHCLHAVTMTGEIDNNLLAWHPKTLKIMHTIRKLRNEGIKAYYSIDTGPSVIILIPNNEKDVIKKKLSTFIDPSKILEGKIGGQAKVLSSKSNKIEPLAQDINKFTH
jgi:mevalonate pyrophosphate decarboxylase